MGSSLWGRRESDTTEPVRLSPLSQQISHNLGTLFRAYSTPQTVQVHVTESPLGPLFGSALLALVTSLSFIPLLHEP